MEWKIIEIELGWLKASAFVHTAYLHIVRLGETEVWVIVFTVISGLCMCFVTEKIFCHSANYYKTKL